jgi:hypothetical protein
MRTPDPLYIVNLINQIVGKALLRHIEAHFELYPTVWRIYEAVGPTVENHIIDMNPATLARIIEYGDCKVAVGVPPIKRQAHLNYLSLDQQISVTGRSFSPGALFNGIIGRRLLEEAAVMSILTVIMDMTHQEEYRFDEEHMREEREMEELLQRHHLPPDHPLYGKPLEVKH